MPRGKRRSADDSCDDLFTGRSSVMAAPMKVFAVRQIRGPVPHPDIIVRAHDGIDANRQFFNHYGLVDTAYRYRLKLAVVPEDHPAYERAIECQHPRLHGETTMEETIAQKFQDVQQMLKETVPAESELFSENMG